MLITHQSFLSLLFVAALPDRPLWDAYFAANFSRLASPSFMRLKDFFFSNLLRGDCGEEGCITGAWKTGIRKGHDFGEDVGAIQKVVTQKTMAWIPGMINYT